MLGVNRHDQITSGVGAYENTEGGRNATNFLRYGEVKEADYEKGLLRVDVQDGTIETAWLPWLTMRSGKDRFWWAPEVGERVVVMAPSGELHNGVVLTAQISSDFPQIADRETVQRTKFDDNTVVEYDRESHVYTFDLTETDDDASELRIKTQKEVLIEVVGAGGKVVVKADRIDLNP